MVFWWEGGVKQLLSNMLVILVRERRNLHFYCLSGLHSERLRNLLEKVYVSSHVWKNTLICQFIRYIHKHSGMTVLDEHYGSAIV